MYEGEPYNFMQFNNATKELLLFDDKNRIVRAIKMFLDENGPDDVGCFVKVPLKYELVEPVEAEEDY